MKKMKIISSGTYIPEKVVTSEELDKKLGLRSGWVEKKSGVRKRHYVTDETSSYMGARAVKSALEDSNLELKDIDCIISASGTYQQAIPCTAALIHEELQKMGYPYMTIPAFDINSTCLSFVTALDTASALIETGRFNRIVIVSSDIASVGLNWEQKESSILFGDSAVAVIIEQTNNSLGLISSHIQTYSEGAHLTEIRGGGTGLHPRVHSEKTKNDFLFDMDGRKVFRLSSKVINGFMDDLLDKSGLSMDDINMVVPHQASGMAMRILRGKLGIPEDRFMNIIEDYGNNIAASIPLALHMGIQSGKIKRGDKVMLLGTSAGLSIGSVIFEY